MKSMATDNENLTNKNNTMVRYKIVLIGNSGAGKTSIIERYSKSTFSSSYQASVGSKFVAKNLIKDRKAYRIQLWDTAGQQRFKSLTPIFIKDANCCLIIYDVSKPQSVNKAAAWLKLIDEHKKQEALTFLVGNKIDIELGQNQQTVELQEELKELQNFQVSAKEGTGIEDLFLKVVKALDPSAEEGEMKYEQEEQLISANSFNDMKLSLIPSSTIKQDLQRQNSAKQCCKT